MAEVSSLGALSCANVDEVPCLLLTGLSAGVQVSSFPLSTMFGMCSAFLGICVVCQRRLDQVVRYEHTLADSNAALLSQTALPKASPGRKHILGDL